MRVALISFETHKDVLFATDLEIALNHLEAGDELLFYRCAGSSPNCWQNIRKTHEPCILCESRARAGFRLAQIPPHCRRDLVWFRDEVEAVEIPHFTSLDEIRDFEFRGVDVGMASVSFLISYRRNPGVQLDTHRDLFVKSIRAGINATLNAERIIETERPDRLVIYNGRLPNYRPYVRVAQRFGVDFACHERGANRFRFGLYENALPHDFGATARHIQSVYRAGPDARADAEAYFTQRRNREDAEQPWVSFAKHQTRTMLPDGFDPKKHNIAIYGSSEDEYLAIDRRDDSLFPSPNHAVRAIASHFEARPDVQVYLRVHPHLKGVRNTQTEAIAALSDLDRLVVLAADSPVDSYALLDACDTVLTFGSTMGVEATYWRKPSILLGNSFYADLDCAYTAHDQTALFGLLAQPNLTAKPIEGAIKYGSYRRTYGQPFRHYLPRTWWDGDFDGQPFKYDGWGAAYRKLSQFIRRKHVGRVYRLVRDAPPVRAVLKPGALHSGVQRALSKIRG